jgi:hypothetical protein
VADTLVTPKQARRPAFQEIRVDGNSHRGSGCPDCGMVISWVEPTPSAVVDTLAAAVGLDASGDPKRCDTVGSSSRRPLCRRYRAARHPRRRSARKRAAGGGIHRPLPGWPGVFYQSTRIRSWTDMSVLS